MINQQPKYVDELLKSTGVPDMGFATKEWVGAQLTRLRTEVSSIEFWSGTAG